MNMKRSLENRIRGWTPQEQFKFRTVTLDMESKRCPVSIPPKYNRRATKTAGVTIISFIFYSIILSIPFVNYTASALQVVVWVTAGAVIGIVWGWLVLGNQLHRLARGYQVHLPRKEYITILSTVVLVAVFAFLASWLFSGPSSGILSILFGPLVLILVFAVSMHTVKYFKFRAFEKRHNMLLLEDWAETGMVAVPKPPQNKQYGGLGL